MNGRIVQIVKALSHLGDDWDLHGLALKFGVSERTIRNDIKSLNTFLDKEGLGRITFGRGGTIQRPGDFSTVMGRLPVHDTFAYKMSRDERRELGAAMLVGAPSYVTLARIAERLSVSRATILNDLDGIKRTIVNAGMRTQSKSSHGIRAQGPERLRRPFLVSFMDTGTPVVDQWLHLPENASIPETLIVIRKVLNEQCHSHGIHLPDDAFRTATNHLCVAVDRNRKGATLPHEDERATHQGDDIAAFAQDVVGLVGQYGSVRMDASEVLSFSQRMRTLRHYSDLYLNVDALQVQKLSREFIRNVSHTIGIDLNHDYDLFEYLSNHLESMFTTDPSRFPHNPSLEEVVSDYPEVMEAVRQNLHVLAAHAGRDITRTEVLYVALHICAALERRKNRGVRPRIVVVCDGGIGTSQLLAEELRGHFDIRIVKVMPAHEVPYIKTYHADLVISTVPLDNCPVDYVEIHLPLTDREYQRIHKKLSSIESTVRVLDTNPEHFTAQELLNRIEPHIRSADPHNERLLREIRLEVRRFFREAQQLESQIIAPYLHQLLPASHIRTNVSCDTWDESIRASAQPLLELGYIKPCYIDAMIASMRTYGPYMALAPGFAIPHGSPTDGSIKMGMSLIRLTTPVSFGSPANDPIEFVCTLSAVDARMHLKAFADLLDMLFKPEVRFLEQLRATVSPEEMAGVIESCEYQVIQQ